MDITFTYGTIWHAEMLYTVLPFCMYSGHLHGLVSTLNSFRMSQLAWYIGPVSCSGDYCFCIESPKSKVGMPLVASCVCDVQAIVRKHVGI